MSEIKTLIKSQIAKNGISGKRTNIGEILTLPFYESGTLAAATEITAQLYAAMPSAVTIGNNNYFIMKNNDINKIILYKFVNRRIGDVSEIYADSSLIKTELNWIPKYDLLDMCLSHCNFLKKNNYI